MSKDKKEQIRELESEIDELANKISELEKLLHNKNSKLIALLRVVDYINTK